MSIRHAQADVFHSCTMTVRTRVGNLRGKGPGGFVFRCECGDTVYADYPANLHRLTEQEFRAAKANQENLKKPCEWWDWNKAVSGI
jgi:hypothetical protein